MITKLFLKTFKYRVRLMSLFSFATPFTWTKCNRLGLNKSIFRKLNNIFLLLYVSIVTTATLEFFIKLYKGQDPEIDNDGIPDVNLNQFIISDNDILKVAAGITIIGVFTFGLGLGMGVNKYG